MSDLRKAAEDLLEVVEAAIKAGDWKVDGACDQDSAIVRLRQALAQPEWVGLTDEERFKISRDTRPYIADTMRAHEEELKRRNT